MTVRRKKLSTEPDSIEAMPDLDDDEQFVVENSNRKTIRKEKVPHQKADPIELDDEPDEPEFPDSPMFGETSLAALQFNDDDNFQNQYCNVLIRRNPDSMNDRFVRPNSAVLTLPPLRNIELTADRTDIEDLIRSTHGGGHYFFQIQINGQLGKSWRASLSDTPEQIASAKAPAASPTPAHAEPAASRDPIDSLLDGVSKFTLLRDALFGAEQKRLENEIAELKRQVAERPEPQPAAALPDNLIILEKALGVSNPTLQERLLDAAFPDDAGEHWIPATLKTVFEHKEEIGGLLGGLLGGLVPQPPKPKGIEDLLRSQPPAAIAAGPPNDEPFTPVTSTFRRAPTPTEKEQTETGGGLADSFGISPDQISEPEDGQIFFITPDMVTTPDADVANNDEYDDLDAKDAEESANDR